MPSVHDFVDPMISGAGPAWCTTQILRWLRQQRSRYEVELSTATREAVQQEAKRVDRLTDELTRLDPRSFDSANEIADALDPLLPDRESTFDPRNVALALDAVFGKKFVQLVRGLLRDASGTAQRPGPHRTRLREGDPVPVVRRRRTRVLSSGALPAEQRPDRLPTLLLAPDSTERITTWLDFTFSEMADLAADVVATAHPAALARRPDHETPGEDDAAHRSAHGAVLAAAARVGLDVLVFGEALLDESLEAQLVDQWRSLPIEARPRLFLPGTRYHDGVGQRTNETRVYASLPAGVSVATAHRKFEPERKWTQGYAVSREAISWREPELTVHVLGDGFKVCVLICRDFLMPDVVRLLEDLAIDLVLVPTNSPKLAPFRATAHALAINDGTTAVVANTWPARSARAVVGRVDTDDGYSTVGSDAARLPGLGVVRCDGASAPEWLTVGAS